MSSRIFPAIEQDEIAATRDALHGYSRILGQCLKASRPRRKHWWHASLRPSLSGLTTGVVNADIDFELNLDLRNSRLDAQTAAGESHSEPLSGQSASDVADTVLEFLTSTGVTRSLMTDMPLDDDSMQHFEKYSEEQANRIGRVFGDVAATMATFRSEITEESSPIQVWPHHFDMSMLWLPGEKIPGQDPENEEYSDKQMNFGFVLGDAGIADPYFYVTAYPTTDALPGMDLPTGVKWETEGFNGAVLMYDTLLQCENPAEALLDWWRLMLQAGRRTMLNTP